jgi:lipopolysaccharide export LptBFGC system permease protein LptF
MKAWINLLNELDTFFEGKSDNEKWMLIGMVFILIGYLSYSLFLPYAEEQYNQSVRKKERLQKSIASNRQYLQSITRGGDRDFYIKKYDRDILQLKKRIDKAHNEITYISSKLEELSPLMFNKESWSKFLNSITRQAKEQEVKIDYIENSYVNNHGSFGHILQIAVGCNGSYRNIVKFFNKLEKSVLVTDIYGASIQLNKEHSTVVADINISVWGINH